MSSRQDIGLPVREPAFKEKWETLSDPRYLLRATIQVADMMRAEGLEPGAEHWNDNRGLFRKTPLARIKELWCQETGREPEWFPWTEDFAVMTWIDWRKSLKHMKPRFRANVGLNGSLFTDVTEPDESDEPDESQT